MKLTGTQIRNELKMLTTELSARTNNFDELLTYKAGETIPNVIGEAQTMLDLETKIGVWQAAQKQYNTEVPISFKGKSINLQQAVSIVGGYSRVSKLFRTAAGAGKKDPYAMRRSRRSSDTSTVVTFDSITTEEAIKQFKRVESDANLLRSAIGKANNIEVEISWLESALSGL